MCECDDVIVHQVETEVKRVFQHHYGLEQWAGWLDDITTHLLQEHIGSPDFSHAARQLILKWTFYRSVLPFEKQQLLPRGQPPESINQDPNLQRLSLSSFAVLTNDIKIYVFHLMEFVSKQLI